VNLKLITVLIFSVTLEASARAPSTYLQLRNDLQRVSKREVSEWVNGLVKASAPSRMVGLPGNEKARNFIQETISTLDPKKSGKLSLHTVAPEIEVVKDFYQKDFDEKVEGKIPKTNPEYKKWTSFTSFMKNFAEKNKTTSVNNVVWEKTGINSDKVLIVTAHFDTISHDKNTLLVKENESMPGANYNASGVAVALGLIKVLSQIDLNYSVKVVFLDWQGIGFHGSYLYAKELKKSQKDILGVINLEMLGQDTSFFDKNKKTGNMSVYLRYNNDEKKWVSKLINYGKEITTKVDFEMKANGFENSDNFRFNEQGFLSATFSQNWEDDFNPKFYQTALDTPETLNHDTLYFSYQYVGGAVLGTLLDLTK